MSERALIVTASPTLMVGPAGSGKTEALLRRAADRYRRDPFAATLVLVPTVRHGDQFRRRLLQACGVALDLQVETPRAVARRFDTGLAVASVGAARELLVSVTRRRIETGAAAHFAPLGAAAALPMLWATVEELLSEDIPAQRFATAAGNYRRPAARRDRGHLRRLPSRPGGAPLDRSGEHCRPRPRQSRTAPALPSLVLVDGFRFFHGGELRLLAALARGRDLLLAFDPDAGERAGHSYERLRGLFPEAAIEPVGGSAPPPRVRGCVTADREAELRAMARAIKRRLTGDHSLRPSDCGVTFRRIAPVLGLARQVFAEYDLPLDPVAGEPLANRPLGVWVRRLLRLPAEGWRLRDLITVLRSGFIDRDRWGLDPPAIARIARLGREQHRWAGREALDRLAESAPANRQAAPNETAMPDTTRAARHGGGPALPGMEARGLAGALAYLYAFLEPPAAPIGAHARQVKTALFGRPPLVRPAVRGHPGLSEEIDALRGHLDDIAALGDALREGPVPFSAFVDRLLARLEAPAAILREAGGVLLAPMGALAGLRLAFLEAGGLVEGEFPASRQAPLLLSRAARQALVGAGLELPPPPEPTEDELWHSVRSRADTALTAWRTRLDERGRQVAASLYFDEADGDAATEKAVPEPAGSGLPPRAGHRLHQRMERRRAGTATAGRRGVGRGAPGRRGGAAPPLVHPCRRIRGYGRVAACGPS